jgi:hypothetical protein
MPRRQPAQETFASSIGAHLRRHSCVQLRHPAWDDMKTGGVSVRRGEDESDELRLTQRTFQRALTRLVSLS